MSEIYNSLRVRTVMNMTQLLYIEREPWGACIILRIFIDGVYICSCSVSSEEYMCNTKHAFVYDSYLKPLHNPNCCGALIDNRTETPIFVLDDNDI